MPSKFIQRGDLIGHAFSDPALLKQALTHRKHTVAQRKMNRQRAEEITRRLLKDLAEED